MLNLRPKQMEEIIFRCKICGVKLKAFKVKKKKKARCPKCKYHLEIPSDTNKDDHFYTLI